MDLQMPVMDGLTATRSIRELESSDPARTRTPIIALTANAMRGDQERCEAAGMDGFLTKPIEIERLRDMLTKFGMVDPSAVAPIPAAQSDNDLLTTRDDLSPPVNLARLNEITGGDAEFAKELADTFVSSGEEQLAGIHAAIGALDREALARVAHKLKGACANIHAEQLRVLTSRLESEAETASAAELQACDLLLQQEFARAKTFLTDPTVIPTLVKAAS
jgi:CheY-like chemotaxis protein